MAYFIPMLTPLTTADVTHRLRADCGITYLIMFRQPKTLTFSKLASAYIFSYLPTWPQAGYDQKIDSQNYYPFVCPHKPIIQHFFSFGQVGFFLHAFPFCRCCSGASLSLFFGEKSVFFLLGRGEGGFREGLWRVGVGGIVLGST